ncbi:MAG: DUF6455 family protein [Hyphomicrobiaceae bacterium]
MDQSPHASLDQTLNLVAGKGRAMGDFCQRRPMLERVFAQADLMDRVMERVGVDAPTAARLDRGMTWYEARSRCIACPYDRQCREWVAPTADAAPRSAPLYCENADFFDVCKQAKR